MKIVILGLIGVAIVNVTLAAQGDKGGKDDTENETSKAQLNMVLEQMKDLRHQLQQQQEQQHLTSEQQLQMTKLMEQQQNRDEKQQEQLKEQQDQLKEQQNQLKEQQDQLKEQQHQDEEQQEKITKIQRTRRSDNETEQHLRELILAELKPLSVEHIKKLVLAEIKPTIDVLSECAIGNYTWVCENSGFKPHHTTTTISFGRTFSRKPKVLVSLAGYRMDWVNKGRVKVLKATVHSPTTTEFNLEIEMKYSALYFEWVDYTWIACA